jgi:adenosylhomocysteine nucleosidase
VIAVCAALRWELRPLLRALGPVRRLRGRHPATWQSRGDLPVLVFQTGVGIAAAASSTATVLAGFPVTAVINAGSAGALVPGMEVGSVVVATAVLHRGLGARPETGVMRQPTEVRLADGLAEAARRRGLVPVREAILSSPVPLTTAGAKRLAREEIGAVAVEMEGAGVGTASHARGVRFASVRVVLDRADQDLELPESGAAWFRILAKAAYPGAIPELAALRRAMRQTESTLEALFTSLRFSARFRGWFDDGP